MAESGKSKKRGGTRLFFQICWTALTNGYAAGFSGAKIFRGASKRFCAPGLNCYSCPGALFSCPVGALQAVTDGGTFRISCYLFGFLTLTGTIFGRAVCGWLCPFGLVQDLAYKIPFLRKIKSLPGHRVLRYAKYAVLALFVLILPGTLIRETGIGTPWFCKLLCPSGTLFGAIPLMAGNAALRAAAGALFRWKVCVLLAVLLLSLLSYRPFCKYLCPLGAVYGLFNGVSLFRMETDSRKCTGCGKCAAVCKMGVDVRRNPNSAECIRCGECAAICPASAVTTPAFSWRRARRESRP